jgi:hypothetical protein
LPEQAYLQAKQALLKAMDTKKLVDSLPVLLQEYQQKLLDEAQHRSHKTALAKELKEKLAFLTPPEKDADGKKTTVPDREKWLEQQKSENPEIKALIEKQLTADFITEADHIAAEMSLQRLQNARIVLSLKTAQIRFLAGDDSTT